MQHPQFNLGKIHTRFIDDNPELFNLSHGQNRAQKLLKYFGDVMVNGPSTPFANDLKAADIQPVVPSINDSGKTVQTGFRDILINNGTKAFVEAVRKNEGLLLTDTTMRDAHQSLLATRIRTYDLLRIAQFVSWHFNKAFSVEMWGGMLNRNYFNIKNKI